MDYKSVDPRILKINENELKARLATPTLDSCEVAELYQRLLSEAKPTYVATRVELMRENGGIQIGGMRTESRALSKFSDGASSYIAMVATLGVGVDRLILKTSKISSTDAFIIDAMADALIEALCDYAEEKLCQGLLTNGRFSPGYADLELSVGYEILSICNAEKLLGIKVSESGLMIPKKSVNALIAVKEV